MEMDVPFQYLWKIRKSDKILGKYCSFWEETCIYFVG